MMMKRVVAVLLLFVGLSFAVSVNHVVLTVTGDPTEMAVSFRLDGKPAGNPVIKYGPGGANLKSLTVTNVAQYVEAQSKSSPIMFLGSATMTGLAAGTAYTYTITPDSKSTPVTYEFNTLPAKATSLRIAMFGDMGSASPNLKAGPYTITDYATKKKIDLVVHYGDLAYNLHNAAGRQGTAFMQKVTSWSAEVPYMVSPGNHEYEYNDAGGPKNGKLNAINYYNHFFGAQTAVGKHSKSTHPLMYYSFDVANVHFVMINAEIACSRSYNGGYSAKNKYYVENTNPQYIIDQYNWVAADMKAAHASGKWIIVATHRQIHQYKYRNWPMSMIMDGIDCSGGKCKMQPCSKTTASTCKYGIRKYIFNYKADVIIQGHAHMYERYYPHTDTNWEKQANIHSMVNPRYPAVMVAGNAGAVAMTFTKRSVDEHVDDYDDDSYIVHDPEVHIHGEPYNGTYADFVDHQSRAAPKLPGSCVAIKYPAKAGAAVPTGWTLITVSGSTKMTVQHIQTGTGKMLDSFTITHTGAAKAVTKAFAVTPRKDKFCVN